jgi:hypothetical protein
MVPSLAVVPMDSCSIATTTTASTRLGIDRTALALLEEFR